jgi:hypothetical protein
VKIKFQRVISKPHGFTTVGYWSWSQPKNRGILTIEVVQMRDRRFELAVWGHECIEALYCWLFGVTTEEADKFDIFYEGEYAAGRIPLTSEPGHDRRCPYHWGHMIGVAWEYVCIYGTFASFKKYGAECDRIMEIFSV